MRKRLLDIAAQFATASGLFLALLACVATPIEWQQGRSFVPPAGGLALGLLLLAASIRRSWKVTGEAAPTYGWDRHVADDTTPDP